MNRSLHHKLNGGISKEVRSGKKMELGHLRIFGCLAYAYVEATERSKLDPKSKKMTFIEYPQGVKGYLLWNSEATKSVISKDIIFDERSILERSRSMGGAGEVKMDSGAQL